MKKIIVLLITVVSIGLLSSCGFNDIKIENYEWQMRSIVHIEDSVAIMDAANKENSAYPEAMIIQMTLKAKNGKLVITDITNNVVYEGTYSVNKRTPKEVHYNISIGDKNGLATVAMTTYADGSKEPTLPINLGGYSMYFYCPAEVD